MNVRSICLAILFDGERTGYDIRKLSTEGDYAYFVEASYGSIYPALARLEEEGLVTSRVEPQAGKPAKKVYAITDAGRRAFIDSLFEPPGPDVFRSEWLLFARFAPHLPADLVEKRLDERISGFEREIERVEQIEADCADRADRWVLDFALGALRHHRDYLAEHRDELIATARPAGSDARAAE